jgi:hypothetical protein
MAERSLGGHLPVVAELAALLLAASGAMWCADAGAQEAAAPIEPEAAAPPETAEPPAPTEAAEGAGPTVDPGWPCDPSVKAGPKVCPRPVRKRWLQHRAQMTQLERVMAKEGPEYSRKKHLRYVGQIVWGGVFVTAGVVGVFWGISYGLNELVNSAANDSAPGEEPHESNNDAGPPGLGIGMFVGGLVSLLIGVPLIISGTKGKNRQKVLRRKDEILAPFDPFAVAISFSADPDKGAGSLHLAVAF